MQLEIIKTKHFSPRFAKKQDGVVGFYHRGSHLWAAPHGERNLALLAVVHRPLTGGPAVVNVWQMLGDDHHTSCNKKQHNVACGNTLENSPSNIGAVPITYLRVVQVKGFFDKRPGTTPSTQGRVSK